jgi:hypothetical protein
LTESALVLLRTILFLKALRSPMSGGFALFSGRPFFFRRRVTVPFAGPDADAWRCCVDERERVLVKDGCRDAREGSALSIVRSGSVWRHREGGIDVFGSSICKEQAAIGDGELEMGL